MLNPVIPNKTTNCVGSALNFAAQPGSIDALRKFVCTFVEKHTFSKDTGIAFSRGIGIGEDSPLLKAIKTDIVTLENAEAEAERLGIGYLDHNGRKGRIGALGAVLWANRGIEAAGLYGEHLLTRT